MLHLRSVALVVVVALAPATRARATDAFFCTDQIGSGGGGLFQFGFGPGEEAAVKIALPASALPLTINDVFLFYASQANDGNASVESIKIYAADGVDALDDPGYPGTVLGTFPAPLVDSTDLINQVALSPGLVVTSGPIWVALHMDRGGPPGPGPATDGQTAPSATDAIFSGGAWADAADLGVAGNWIIRIETDAAAAQDDAACRIAAGEGEGEGGEGEGGEGEGQAGEGEGEGEGEGAAALAITSVNPSSAAQGATTRITVTGTGFVDGVAVRVDSADCADVQIENEGALLCTVPATLPPGAHDVIAQQGADTFDFPKGFTVTAGGCGCGATTPSDGALALVVVALLRRRRAHRSLGGGDT